MSVSTLADFEALFREIPLDRVTTSMTINCTASVALAMYLALADKQGVSWDKIGGTMQNDMLKEFIAQKEWISPPESAVRVVVDTIEFCARHVPRFNPVSISGYHIREAGSTAVQELAFTLADGFGYVQAGVARGLDVDAFAPRLSFFFDVHNDFFEEIAKLRAARRIWATVMRERFGAKKPESMRLRTHTQTAGVSATAQQPLNNVARVAIQALAAVLGGAQSLHTNSYDEVLALPDGGGGDGGPPDPADHRRGDGRALDHRSARRLLLPRDAHRPDGGAGDGLHPEDRRAGRHRPRHRPRLPAEGDRRRRLSLPAHGGPRASGRWWGSTSTSCPTSARSSTLRLDEAVEPEQIERVKRVKAGRDASRVERRLKQLADACRGGSNVMPVLVDAVKDYVSLGEISDVYRQVFGLYREPIIF